MIAVFLVLLARWATLLVSIARAEASDAYLWGIFAPGALIAGNLTTWIGVACAVWIYKDG